MIKAIRLRDIYYKIVYVSVCVCAMPQDTTQVVTQGKKKREKNIKKSFATSFILHYDALLSFQRTKSTQQEFLLKLHRGRRIQSFERPCKLSAASSNIHRKKSSVVDNLYQALRLSSQKSHSIVEIQRDIVIVLFIFVDKFPFSGGKGNSTTAFFGFVASNSIKTLFRF